MGAVLAPGNCARARPPSLLRTPLFSAATEHTGAASTTRRATRAPRSGAPLATVATVRRRD